MKRIKELSKLKGKMDNLFVEYYDRIRKSKPMTRDKLPTYRGVYVFYENNKAIYVGRANDIRKRIQWHTRKSSGSESASFAFNLAKMEFSKKAVDKTRKELMEIEEFVEIFEKHKINLHNSEFRCIRIDNDILQTMFEPYLAYKLGTYPKNNTFENH